MSDAIGGYFELEFPAPNAPLYPGAIEFQSARAAFLALLQAGRPRRVWMPYYMCRTMFDSLRQADVDVTFYRIDEGFRLAENIRPADGEWLVYVNYFGLRTRYAYSLLDRFDPSCIVIDASQALFSPPFHCLASIYSPRKFLGVPDGGWLISSLSLEEPAVVDDGSYERALPLLKRAAFSPEEAYAGHHSAEQTLFHQGPRRMSALTRRILSSIDYDSVRRARNRNFAYLHARLGRHNLLQIDPVEADGPMCYPLLMESAGLRECLIRKKIYVPTYWNDVLKHAEHALYETFLARNLVPLPCDQRYGESEMERIVEACQEYWETAGQDSAVASDMREQWNWAVASGSRITEGTQAGNIKCP